MSQVGSTPAALPHLSWMDQPRDGASPTSDSADGLGVLRWEGDADGWWQRNRAEVGAAVGVGAIGAAAIAAFLLKVETSLGNRQVGLAIAAAGVAGATSAAVATHWIGSRNDRTPDFPSPSLVPHFPIAEAPVPVPGGALSPGAKIGKGEGSYSERVAVTKTRTGRDGKPEKYTDYETRQQRFDWEMQVEGQIGDREGYADLGTAIEQLPEGDAVALRAQAGRIVAYDMYSGDHWDDLSKLTVSDSTVRAVVAPSGEIFTRDGTTSKFSSVRTIVERSDTTKALGDAVGRHSIPHRTDPKVEVRRIVTGADGVGSLARALGEAMDRSGDQVVFDIDGRFQVADVAISSGSALDRSVTNRGFLVDGNSKHVVAVEQEGEMWAPVGAWYVQPHITD